MQWPERPTCHDEDAQASSFRRKWTWDKHPPDARWPNGEPFRRCSYCGSMHPEDLVAAIEAGARLSGSDWKYGWPHKFYVEGIHNPNRDEQAEVGGRSYFDEVKGERVYEPTYAAQGDFNAKWYNLHLKDQGYDTEAIGKLLVLLAQHTDIEFALEDGRLRYKAPHWGYQRY